MGGKIIRQRNMTKDKRFDKSITDDMIVLCQSENRKIERCNIETIPEI